MKILVASAEVRCWIEAEVEEEMKAASEKPVDGITKGRIEMARKGMNRVVVEVDPRDESRWPDPTMNQPCMEMISDMCLGGIDAIATDGCEPVEPDGMCEHGHPAWPLWMGVI